MSDVVRRDEVDALLDAADIRTSEATLVEWLSRPVRDLGPGGVVAPDEDVADHVRARGASDLDVTRLSLLASRVARAWTTRVLRPSDAADPSRAAALLARLAHLAVALELWHCDVHFAISADALRDGGCEERDLFGILRALARNDVLDGSDPDAWWRPWLAHPAKGIRTVAAQSLVRLVPFEDLPALLGELAVLDLNWGIVCRDWLRRADVEDDVSWAARVLDDGVRAAVAYGLSEAGEDGAAAVVRNPTATAASADAR